MKNDVLYNFISPVTGRLPLTNNYILVGALDNFSVMSPKLIDMQLDIINIRHYIDNIAASSFIIGLPNNDLPKAQVLSNLDNGFLFNTDGIISTQAVPLTTDATYIIRTPNINLPEAQVLEELGTGMAKIVADGAFAIAIAGEDYATTEQLEEIEQQCQQYAEQAATSAGEAATSAGEATASATEATGAATEATASAAVASGSATAAGVSAAGALASAGAAALSAGSASSSATNATNSATAAQGYLNTLLNTGLTLQGDVTGSGLLSNPIVTTFKLNPVFPGSASVTIPVGTVSQRPSSPLFGMVRANSDTNVIEYYTSSSWVTLNSSNATVSSVNITGSTGISISGSPITSSGTITLTLSSGLQDLSSYSSASFLQVANNLSDILNSSTARANLGLTNVATQAVTNNSILIGGASNSIASQALTNGQILIGSTGAAPVATVPTNGTNISWTTGAGSLTANISGQIALSNGGTGISLTTAYGILCGGTTSTGNLQNAGTGSSGYFLGGNGASALPSWKTAVTSVAVTGSTGLTVSGSPITSTGTISLTLANELQYFSQLYPFSALYGGLIYRKANYPFAPSYTMMNFAVSGSGFNLSMSDSYYTFSLGTELQGLSGLSSTGIIVRTGSGTYTTRTITAGNSSITVNNGDGLTANPSITIGTVPIANLANYPSSSTQFLRGNGSWSQPTFNDIGSPTSGSTLDFNNSTITNLGSLSVNSTASGIPSATWFAYFKIQQTGIAAYSAISGVWNAGGPPRSIICSGAISATEFESVSSIKKKNIISKYEEFKEELKEKFDTIDFVKYEWKDKLKEGFGEYYGYIAENVSKAFPELVNLKHTEYAPNILEYADLSHISGKNYRIIFSEDIEIEIDKKLKIISKNEKTFEAILTMKENNNSYLLSFLTDAPPVGEFLVYGSYEEVPLVSKTRFHDMSAARLKILIDEVSNLSQRIDKIENVVLNP